MGASGKWVISLVGLKKSDKVDHVSQSNPQPKKEKVSGKGKKWRLWRSSSGDLGSSWKGFKVSHRSASECSGSSPLHTDTFTSAMATVARAPPRDFRKMRQEWAAIRIQTAFRGFLARRALRALRGVVRLQALVRGRQVRKKAAVTLKCMQALVRVQARVRASRVPMSMEGQAEQTMLNERHSQSDILKQAEEEWCDSKNTLQDVKTKLQVRQEGAVKRERAIAYSLAQKQWRSISGPKPQTNSCGWSWMEAKPWESRLIEQSNVEASVTTPPPNTVRRNNVSTRISLKPPPIVQATCSSSSPSSELCCDRSSVSSSFCTSTPIPGNTGLATDLTGENGNRMPNYMNLTVSTKAKRKPYSHMSLRTQRQSMDEVQFLKMSAALSNGDSKSIAGSDHSVNLARSICMTTRFDRNSKQQEGW